MACSEHSTLPHQIPTIKSAHVRLLVSDFDKEYGFLRDVLGLKSTFGAEGEVYADFDANGLSLAIFKRDLMSEDLKTSHLEWQAEGQDRVALILGVSDVDGMAQRLREHGLLLVTEPLAIVPSGAFESPTFAIQTETCSRSIRGLGDSFTAFHTLRTTWVLIGLWLSCRRLHVDFCYCLSQKEQSLSDPPGIQDGLSLQQSHRKGVALART